MKKYFVGLILAVLLGVSPLYAQMIGGGMIGGSGGGGGSGDVTIVGDCTSGDCGDGTSDGGTYYRYYDGTANYLQIGAQAVALGANKILYFPAACTNGSILQVTVAGNNWTAACVTSVSSITLGGFTASKVVQSDGSGNLVSGAFNFGTMTDTKWCKYTAVGGLACDQDTPAGLTAADIVAYTNDASPTSTDTMITVNDPGGTPALREVTLANTITKAHGLTGENYLIKLNASDVMEATNSLGSVSIDLGVSVASGHAVTMDVNGVLQTTFDALLPDAADGATLGNATYEWSDLYLATGGVIYGENDQSNNLTSSSTGWTTSLDLTVNGGDLTIAAAGVKLTGSNGSLTILGLGDGQDEDVKIDLNTNANQITVSSPASSADTLSLSALHLVTTGQISGRIPVATDADGKTLSGTDLYGSMQMATGAGTWTIPDVDAAAGTGLSFCVYSTTAAEIVIAGNAEDKIRLNGVLGAADGDITNNTAEAAGDFICLVLTDFAGDVAHWTTFGYKGTWTVVP